MTFIKLKESFAANIHPVIIFISMKKLRNFFRQYREEGEADIEISINLWHVVIFLGLVAYAIYVFS